MTVTAHLRLEPRPHERNLAEGFGAATADPVWFLARQWQMGEHQGENASSPVWVDYRLRQRPIASADPRFDPLEIPAEAIVESEVDDWWTLGRRVRIGRRFVGLGLDPALLFHRPPPPYEQFDGAPDGLLVWRAQAALGLGPDAFPEDIPPDSTPDWDSEELLYEQTPATSFTASGQALTVRRHRGGRLDWHSVDAGLPVAPLVGEKREAIPTPLGYPGAPSTRWWQIENADVDLGGYPPDSAHASTALLTDLIFSHSDDWFLFPVLASAGHVVAVESVQVRDSFGRLYDETAHAGLRPPVDWTLFAVDPLTPGDDGLSPEELVLWHVAELPLEGAPVERVQLGLDEQSNLLWAVERMVDGRDVDQRLLSAARRADLQRRRTIGRQSPRPASTPTSRRRVSAPWWTPYTLSEEGSSKAPRAAQPRRPVAAEAQADARPGRAGAAARRGEAGPRDRTACRAQQRHRAHPALVAGPRHARQAGALGAARARPAVIATRPYAALRRDGGGKAPAGVTGALRSHRPRRGGRFRPMWSGLGGHGGT